MGYPARLYPEEAERPSQGRRLHLLPCAGRGVVSHIHAAERYGSVRTAWWAGHHGRRLHRERALRDRDDTRDRGALRTRRASGRSRRVGNVTTLRWLALRTKTSHRNYPESSSQRAPKRLTAVWRILVFGLHPTRRSHPPPPASG